jgi:hypothetical protein
MVTIARTKKTTACIAYGKPVEKEGSVPNRQNKRARIANLLVFLIVYQS